MSEYDLLPESAYENLPEDPHDKFAVLVRIAQSNLARLLDNTDSGDFSDEIRSQFTSIIIGVAEALDIEGLPPYSDDLNTYRAYQQFRVHLAGVVAKVRLRGDLVAKPHSVELGRVTKARIQQDIDLLRNNIQNSELSDKKQIALLEKIDDLQDELNRQRLSFAKTMAITSAILVGIGGATTALANGPQAKETVIHIIELIGMDKEREEEERLRLAPPPKALPDFSASKPSGAPFDDLDDEVPF